VEKAQKNLRRTLAQPTPAQLRVTQIQPCMVQMVFQPSDH